MASPQMNNMKWKRCISPKILHSKESNENTTTKIIAVKTPPKQQQIKSSLKNI
jgi:hypothetical protein